MRRSLPAVRRVALLLVLVACGSRTGLLIDGEEFSVIPPTLDGGDDIDGSREKDGELSLLL